MTFIFARPYWSLEEILIKHIIVLIIAAGQAQAAPVQIA